MLTCRLHQILTRPSQCHSTNQTRQSKLLLSNFGEPVQTVASVSFY